MIFSMRHRGGFSDVSARLGDWKVVRMYNQPWRLFDISKDLEESNDLAAENTERVAEMLKVTKAWSQTHKAPLFFDSELARKKWNEGDMLDFDKTFEPVTGAPAIRPLSHITDNDAEEPAPAVTASSPGKPGVKLKKGDSTLEHFIEMEKVKWEKNGWRWNQSKVEELFKKMDTNQDGIASGLEKKAHWAK